MSLRARIWKGVALCAGVAVVALWAGLILAGRSDDPLLFAGLFGSFALIFVAAGFGYLLDDRLARPLERVAAWLRACSHAEHLPTAPNAQDLGDLLPAAKALAEETHLAHRAADRLTQERTALLEAERTRLAQILTEIPIATILLSPEGRITLYDGQAAEVLASIAPPRLHARITSYLDPAAVEQAQRQVAKTGRPVSFTARAGDQALDCALKPLGTDGNSVLLIEHAEAKLAPEASRPLAYDFGMVAKPPETLAQCPLDRLTCVVFDLETTGLLPHKDDVVQIGALRVMNGRILAGEEVDELVNPGRPIPPASTRVHGINDAMVAGAADFATTSRRFHHFCEDAVIVAHNAPFDMAFLHKSGKATGCTWDHPILDTVLLSAVLYGTSEPHALDALCDRLGVTIPAHLRHTALGDARATAEALVRMIPMLMSRGIRTLGQTIEATSQHGRLIQDLNTPADA
ncbi:DNA polymerase-3 subunit epsilon [Poseidonocella pacifica]|uniref:DNA-directed DNA polymerase n=1 Tax=Poseidonocella pacifica TaxID=871651 RepID=A0A1I0VTW4_9RHOB|nr:3'-5' exonuclease [Poseidonocella pacifica]SFA79849.1 DNA polymerase-3 subunit epsilon [Poseidonocella pacifica]